MVIVVLLVLAPCVLELGSQSEGDNVILSPLDQYPYAAIIVQNIGNTLYLDCLYVTLFLPVLKVLMWLQCYTQFPIFHFRLGIMCEAYLRPSSTITPVCIVGNRSGSRGWCLRQACRHDRMA